MLGQATRFAGSAWASLTTGGSGALQPNLVLEAIRNAMDTCRPDWSNDLKTWRISLIDFSLRSSVAKYDDSWWRQNNGIPTGDSLCVQLENITVFYVMSNKVYNVPNMMVNIPSIKRRRM